MGKWKKGTHLMEEIFPSLNSSYFIFESLATTHPRGKYGRMGGIGWTQATNLRNEATGKLSSLDLIGINNDKEESNIDRAMTFLYEAAQAEAAREKSLFQKILSSNIIKNSAYSKELQACFQGDTIDYNLFTITVERINKGNKEAATLFQEAFEETQAFNNAIHKVAESDETMVKLLQSGNIRPVIHSLYAEHDYAKEKIISPEFRGLQDSNVIINALAGRGKQNRIDFTKFIQKRLGYLLNEGYIQVPYNDVDYKDAFLLEMIKEIQKLALRKLKKAGNTNPTVNQLIDAATKLMNSVMQEAVAKKKGVITTTSTELERIKSLSQNLARSEDALRTLQDTMFVNKGNIGIGKNGRLINLTKKNRQLIESFLATHNIQITDFSDRDFRSSRVQLEYEKEVRAAMNLYFQKTLDKTAETISSEDYAQELTNIIRRAKNPKFTISAQTEEGSRLDMTVFFKKLGAAIGSLTIGGRQEKTDVSALVYLGNAHISPDENITNDTILTYLSRKADETFQEARKEALKKERTDIETIFNGKREEFFGSDQAASYRADAIANTKSLERIGLELQNLYKEAGKELTDEETVSILTNLFRVDNSVKRYEYYIDEKGFNGGSIGATIYEQVYNIAQVAHDAGISIDTEWLVFAAINCSEGLIGASLSPHLSQFFSIFASFLMFNSSNEFIKQVNEHANNFVRALSGNVLHLYTLQGRFVLSSGVLFATYEALKNIVQQLSTSNNKGYNQAIIHNNAGLDTAGAYPRPWNKDGNTGTTNFQNFSSNHISNVSIDMQLLIGFLGLLDDLQKAAQTLPI